MFLVAPLLLSYLGFKTYHIVDSVHHDIINVYYDICTFPVPGILFSQYFPLFSHHFASFRYKSSLGFEKLGLNWACTVLPSFCYGLNTTFWSCPRFWPLSLPPGMDPGVLCNGMKANPTLFLRSKSECFLMSGYQDMDYILYFGDVLDFDFKPHPRTWTLGSGVVEWTLTLQAMVQVWMLSDKWFSRCGLLENYSTEILNVWGVLVFDL